MSFVKATISFKPASVGTGIKCSLRKGKTSPATITLYLNNAIAENANIADNSGIEVMIGEGEHHGLIRIRKNNSATDTKAEHRTTGKGAFFLIKLGHQPAFVDRSEPSAWCQWEKVEDGYIEIVLPKWADETSPRKKTVFGTERADGGANIKTLHTNINTKQLSGERPVVKDKPAAKSVTANLMGDPAPGRREMLQKMGEMKG